MTVPNAPVSVEIAPPDSKESLKAVLLDACSRTVRDTECVESAPESTPPSVVAIVSFKAPENAHLEVALRSEQRWVTRDIRFADGDPPEERWRTVGLVIGTLASVLTRHEESPGAPAAPAPAPGVPAPEAPPGEKDERETPSTSGPRAGWIGAGAVLGPALDTGPLRLGGELSGHLHLGSRVYGTVGGVLSQSLGRVQDVRSSFQEAFAGAAIDFDLQREWAIVGRAEAFVERFEPSVSEGSTAPTAGERWLGGARLGADLFYWGTAPVGFFLGASGRVASGATDVRAGGQFVGAATAVSGFARLGIAVAWR